MSVKSITYKLFSILALILVSSCTQELLDADTEPIGKSVEVRFSVGVDTSNAVPDPERSIKRVRILIFGSYNSADRGRLIKSHYQVFPAGEHSHTIPPMLITGGYRDIYIIANEPLGTDGNPLSAYRNITSPDKIAELQVPYSGGVNIGSIEAGIPMFRSYMNRKVYGETNQFGISNDEQLERMMAKISLTINNPGIAGSTEKITITSVELNGIPKWSYLIPSQYRESMFVSPIPSVTVTPNTDNTIYTCEDIYFPEHIVWKEKSSIKISGKTTSGVTVSWILNLGDAMINQPSAAPVGTPYNVSRNMHYNMTATIKTFGQSDGMIVKISVVPWNTVDMSEDVGDNYVTLSKVMSDFDTEIGNGSIVNNQCAAIKVLCWTNVGGWYAVARNDKGVVIYKSTPTNAVSSRTEQTVYVELPSLPGIRSEPKAYTVCIYHPIVGSESVGPIKEFKFLQL